MADSTYSQSRIAKNTIFLYIRMFITMGVTLYTSRVILDVLGIEDFGIYNIIGGIVVLLSIVSNSMTTSTQRFITYELGFGDDERVSRTFSMGMIAHFIICGVILVLGETIGLWYVLEELNIPKGREAAAMWVYQISLITIFLTLIRAPYNATVIAHEKMSFYAYMSIVDVLFKLLSVSVLVFSPVDKLVTYGLLVMLTNIFLNFLYYRYCKKHFNTCNFQFIIDRSYFKKMFSYLGWNLVGAGASLGTQQAGNLIINKYLGVAVNAAYGISSQVNGAINSFVSNFQVAFTPQLVKLFSQNKMDDFWKLSKTSALLSYYLLFIIAFPIFVNIDYVLSTWLVEVPAYAGTFCQLLIIYSLIDAVQAPLWIGINATGNIKVYEIWLSLILLLNIPFSILVLSLGWAPYWVLIVRVLLNFLTSIVRCFHVKWQFNFPIFQYLIQVICRVMFVTIATTILWYASTLLYSVSSFIGFCCYYVASIIVIGIIIYALGIGKNERLQVLKIISSKIKKTK